MKIYFSLLIAFISICTFNISNAQKIWVSYHNDIGAEIEDPKQASYFSEYHITDTGVFHYKFFMDNSKIALSESFKDTISYHKEGKYVKFYHNGNVALVGNFVNNRQKGVWLEFYSNGNLKDSTYYEQSKPVGIYKMWHENGVLSDSCHVLGDKTFNYSWFDNGSPNSFGYTKNYYKIGQWTYYHQNGAIAAEIEYEDKGEIKKAKYFNTKGNRGLRENDYSENLYWQKSFNKIFINIDNAIERNKLEALANTATNAKIVITIDADGNIIETYLFTPSNIAKINNIILATIKDIKALEPAYLNNRKDKLTLNFYYRYTPDRKSDSYLRRFPSANFKNKDGLYDSRFDSRIESNRRFDASLRGQGINDKW